MSRRASLLIAAFAACTGSSSTFPSAATITSAEMSSANVRPRPAFRSYVILGDSISDRGGTGPFFYDVLAEDLKAKLGDVQVVKRSRSGARSEELLAQVQALPEALPGPVAVSVTIGGNDMRVAAVDILAGFDGRARKRFATNLTRAYDELSRKGRFGEGVEVTIFHGSIYDPSDGEGNFAEAGCPAYLRDFPKIPTRGYWDHWNEEASRAITKYGDAVVKVDIRGRFQGHGVGKSATWFDRDCIHPNDRGHAELRKLFLAFIAP